MTACLNCNATEQEKPLLTIKFQGNEIYICPQCLPVLIQACQPGREAAGRGEFWRTC